MLLMKEISVERNSRVDSGNISNSLQSYIHTNGENIARFDISVKGVGGKKEKVEGGKF